MPEEQRIIAAALRETQRARVRDRADQARLMAERLEQRLRELEKLIESPRGTDKA